MPINTTYLAPAMQVLHRAEEINKKLGHTNLGYLSFSHGFMPKEEPLRKMPIAFKIWDTVCEQTPELIKNLNFRDVIKNLPVLIPDEQNLEEKYLSRASMLLGFFAHAYANCAGELLSQKDVPDSIMIPWKTISRRLHRPEPFLSYFDLIAYNWKFKDETNKTKSLENMDLLYPIFNCDEESNLYLIQTEMMVNASPMVQAVAQAHQATLKNDHHLLGNSLQIMINCLKHITNVSFAKLSYNKRSKNYMDPVVFTKTMMSFAVPIKEDMPGPSGTSFPYAHLTDIFIGRKKYDEGISKEALRIRNLYPPHVKDFLNAVSKISVEDYILKSNCTELKKLYTALVDAYSGENGFLNIHRKRVYSFIQTSFKVGRPQTIGGFDGNNEDEWENVNIALRNMQNERPRCPFAQKSGKKQTAEKEKRLTNFKTSNDQFTVSSIAQHSCEEKGYWVLYENQVLDLTKYIKKHPGGETSLLEYVGSNITKEFERIHSESVIANKIAQKLSIGVLNEPIFENKILKELYVAQKNFLWKLIELHNVFLLEVDVKNKSCFPNEENNAAYPYKSFLEKNSFQRFKSSYKAKLLSSAQALIDWSDQYNAGWNQRCPFSMMQSQLKHFKPRKKSTELSIQKNLDNLLKLKADAIELCMVLECDIDNCILEEVKQRTKSILRQAEKIDEID